METQKERNKRKLENLEAENNQEQINHVLDQSGFGVGSLTDLVDCLDLYDSDEDCHTEVANLLAALEEPRKEDDTSEKLLKTGQKYEKIKEGLTLGREVFTELARKISAYSKYCGTKTVHFNNGNLQISEISAAPTTIQESDDVLESYLQLENTTLELARNVDRKSPEFCCLAKLYRQLKGLDSNECNQQNAIYLAQTLNEFEVYNNTSTEEENLESDFLNEYSPNINDGLMALMLIGTEFTIHSKMD
ncbi:MAG: hypothetical protein K0T99_02555 [Alphaproteobacteria bacterium]|nr:hypothetical protein [Alphaproteobacteria bacterium]